MEQNYEYKQINAKIGKIRMRQALTLKNTGCFVLCGPLIVPCLISNPSIATASVLGFDIFVTTYYGIRSYMYQKEIENLREGKTKIKQKQYSR